jgi:hypothetical protein
MRALAVAPINSEQPMPKRVSVAAPSDKAPARDEGA